MAAYIYSQQHPGNQWVFTAALPAFIIEGLFYLGSIFPKTRESFGSFRPARLQAALLWISALIPYLIFSLSAGTFNRNAFYLLVGLMAIFSFWHAVLPRRMAYDFGFLVIAAAPVVTRVFARIYREPSAQLHIGDALGHLAWIRVGIVALLVLREWDPGAFGAWPRKEEWRDGFIYYLIAVGPLVGLALLLHDVRFAPALGSAWRLAALSVGQFFAIFWVVALSEELFFRGVVMKAILNEWRTPTLAVILSSLLYGCSHLWFRQFPNWRDAVVTTLLGLVCGIAYGRSGSVRTPMVTHALVAVTARMLFRP